MRGTISCRHCSLEELRWRLRWPGCNSDLIAMKVQFTQNPYQDLLQTCSIFKSLIKLIQWAPLSTDVRKHNMRKQLTRAKRCRASSVMLWTTFIVIRTWLPSQTIRECPLHLSKSFASMCRHMTSASRARCVLEEGEVRLINQERLLIHWLRDFLKKYGYRINNYLSI